MDMEHLQHVERLLAIIESQTKLHENTADWMRASSALDDIRASDIAELREGMAALSNRIEGLTRMVADHEAVVRDPEAWRAVAAEGRKFA
jgi:hypothetical protein